MGAHIVALSCLLERGNLYTGEQRGDRSPDPERRDPEVCGAVALDLESEFGLAELVGHVEVRVATGVLHALQQTGGVEVQFVDLRPANRVHDLSAAAARETDDWNLLHGEILEWKIHARDLPPQHGHQRLLALCPLALLTELYVDERLVYTLL